MKNVQRIQFMYIVGLATLIKRQDLLDAFAGVFDLIDADEGLSDGQIVAVIEANISSLVGQLEASRPVADADESSDRYLNIEICRRQFGGDKWDRYSDDYLAEVAERAIEQAHAHAINEDADREAERIATRERNLGIIARVSGLSARYFDMFDDETVANTAAVVLSEQEDEARKENARRDRARSGFGDFLRSLFCSPVILPTYRTNGVILG